MINNDHDQQSTADPFLTWKKFVFKEKLLWKLKEMISVLYMLSCLLQQRFDYSTLC